jgi:hypothetical protein
MGTLKRLLVLVLILSGCYSHRTSHAQQNTVHIFILMGQSNMTGVGEGNGLPIDSRVQNFQFDYKWKTAQDPLFDPTNGIDPLQYDSLQNIGVGLGRYFADELLKTHPDWRIGFIPCAKREADISTFYPSKDRGTFYGSALERVHQAQQYGEISGILFYHGESAGEWPDPSDPNAVNYGDRFSYVLNSFRSDIGIPNLPIVYCQIWGHQGGSWDYIKDQQAKAHLSNSVMFVTDNVNPTFHRDDNHWYTRGYEAIGRGMANLFESKFVDRSWSLERLISG